MMHWKQQHHLFNQADRNRPGPIGLIFDIHRLPVQGGGIRTMVFFKGCPLRCQWCPNPESMNSAPEIMRIPHPCSSCVKCMTVCPRKAIRLTEYGQIAIDRTVCNLCGDCVSACYADSMHIAGRYLTVAEVMEEVEGDRKFYKERGGVTFTGGEPTMQYPFLRECLHAAKARGLHTAMKTCGQAPWEVFAALIDCLDLAICDLKHMDPVQHRRLTGVSNERIFENLTRLSKAGVPLELRLPLIPGVNDTTDNIKATAQFAASLSSSQGLSIQPYRHVGKSKWQQLGRDYRMSDILPHTREEVLAWAALAEKYVGGVGIGG